MRFSMILEMVDRLSGPARRARAGARGLADQARAMGQRIRQAAGDLRRGDRSLTDLARSARRMAAAGLRQTFDRAGAGARRLIRNLRDLERRLRLAERAGFATGRALRNLGGAGLGMLKGGLFAGGAAVAGAGSFALFDLFRTAGQFEQYQASLEGTEGSVQAAKNSMAWVQKFARETPYELDQVMESFVQLRNFGLDPMDGSLAALGDASAAISKPLSSAVEMLADATQGEFERLKEFGIRARKEGNRTVFSFVKDGKDIQRSVAGTGVVIQEALVDIFKERFGGGMVRQSKTLFGIISNIKATWSEFLLMVAEAGIFDFVKQKLQGLLDKVNAMAANGDLQRWAKDISDRMIKAWKWAEKFIDSDWDDAVQDLHDIGEAVKFVADTILELKRAKDNFGGWTTLSPVGTLYAAARASGIGDGLKSLRGSLAPKPKPAAPGSPATRLPSDNDFMRRLKPQSSLTLDGALKIDVSGPPGLAVRATPISTPGSKLTMDVRTGRTMRGSA
jgi:hypothetical protein